VDAAEPTGDWQRPLSGVVTVERLCWRSELIVARSSFSSTSYTVNHKKRDILFLTITLAHLNRFLQFLYHFNREEILHATVEKFTTSP